MKNSAVTSGEEDPATRVARAIQSSSLGSLTAVAALIAAGKAAAAPQLSTTTVNISLTNGAQFDINGDGRMDFSISDNFNNHQELVLAGLNGSLSARSGTYGQYNYYSQVLNEGSPVNGTLTYDYRTDLSRSGNTQSPAYLGTFYSGVEFYDIGNSLHYGWVNFSFPSNTYPWSGATAVSAGWESTPNTGILVGAVPEPSLPAMGSIAMVVLLTVRFLKRKHRTV